MQSELKTVDAIREFAYAGNATLTLKSGRTGGHFTYKLHRKRQDQPIFVSVLTGQDNETDYTFLGTIFLAENQYRHGRKSSIREVAPSAKTFRWFHTTVLADQGKIHPELHVYHEGRCGRCGRKLTNPESIERGIGPECADKL